MKSLFSKEQGFLALFLMAYFGFVGLYAPFFGPYLKANGYDIQTIALAVGTMPLMRLFGPFVWASLADYSGLRVFWIRLGAFAGFFFSIFLLFQIESTSWLILFTLCLNFSVSGLVPMSDAVCMDVCNHDTGRYGKIRLFGSLGFVLLVVLFGAFVHHFGYDSYPIWLSFVLFLTFAFSIFFHDIKVVHSTKVSKVSSFALFLQDIPCLLDSVQIRRFWLSSFLMLMAHGVFYGYYSLFLLEHGYGEAQIGGLWALGVVCEILFFAFQSKFFKHWGLGQWLIFSYGVCAARFLMTAWFPQSFLVMCVAQGLHAFTFAAHHTASIAWLRSTLPSSVMVRGQAMYSMIGYGLGGISGTFLGRYVWESLGYGAVFYWASLAGLLAFIVGLKLKE